MPDLLLATDADYVADEVVASAGGPGVTIRRVRAGRDVLPAVEAQLPDLVVLDLQIGNMGGMATCMGLRLEEGVGRLPHIPVLMLLDRVPDVFLARRSEADEWLVKPLDPFRMRRVMAKLMEEGPSASHIGPPMAGVVERVGPDEDDDEDDDDRPRSWRKRQRHPASG